MSVLGYEDLNSFCQAMYFSARVFPEAFTLLLAAYIWEQNESNEPIEMCSGTNATPYHPASGA